jgi:hypothetical protein
VNFEYEAAEKRNLPIFSAIATDNHPDGTSVLLIVHEDMHNGIVIH